MTTKMMTVDQLADMLSVNPITIRRMIKRGQIPAIRVGRSIRFRPEDVEAFLASVRVIPDSMKDGKHE